MMDACKRDDLDGDCSENFTEEDDFCPVCRYRYVIDEEEQE